MASAASRRATSSVSAAVVVTMGCNERNAETVQSCAPILCETALESDHHEGAAPPLWPDRAVTPGPAGPAGLAAAARHHHRLLPGRRVHREFARPAADLLARSAPAGRRVHARLVHDSDARVRQTRPLPADDDGRV